MFSRFTERAQKVLIFSQEEAQQLKHEAVGTEHLLLGLIREGEGVSARVLNNLGVSLEKVREEVNRLIGPGQSVTEEIGLYWNYP